MKFSRIFGGPLSMSATVLAAEQVLDDRGPGPVTEALMPAGLYQEDFVMPGSSPRCASRRKLMRETPALPT
jgi:hypothetical protein